MAYHAGSITVGEHPTTLGFGEEMHVTSFVVGEETPATAHVGEHPTTLMIGEEVHFTSLVVGEEHPTHPLGEGHPGAGGPRGPFG